MYSPLLSTRGRGSEEGAIEKGEEGKGEREDNGKEASLTDDSCKGGGGRKESRPPPRFIGLLPILSRAQNAAKHGEDVCSCIYTHINIYKCTQARAG